LYLFAENTDNSPKKTGSKSRAFEDIYVLDLIDEEGRPRRDQGWERVSPEGQTPGLLENVSMVEANGVIYVFGSSSAGGGQRKSVLWIYNTNDKTWSEAKNIKLTARPNQRAVVYNNQLLIVHWSFVTELVDIQYQNLNELNVVIEASTKKQRTCKGKPEGFLQKAKNIYHGKLFTDVTFEVEGEEIPAHKAILAYHCDYFMKMFTSGMSESHEAKISIPHIKSCVFKAVLQYIYCNELELDEQLALDLIPVVDEYLMTELKGFCEKYLCKQLRKDNVVDMLIVADRHEIEELKKACFRFISKHIKNIEDNEEMKKLSKSLFTELLKSTAKSGSQNDETKH